jgi:hypothetical protein
MKTRKPRCPKPNESLEVFVEEHWPQFAEEHDPSSITIHVGENLYDESCVTLLRKQSQWMQRAADWLEAQNKVRGRK